MAKRTNVPAGRWGKSPWHVNFRPKEKPLPEKLDFVIVGGGFAGLSAAAHLQRLAPRKSVLLLEAGSLGNGASGRTGGMALDATAAGKLPGLGNVLADYRKILRDLGVRADLSLPGALEIARGGSAPSLESPGKKLTFQKNSPISWSDSGNLRVVRKVPGGTVDPGKIVAGLARAAENAGAQIIEHGEVRSLEFASSPRLHVQIRTGRKTQTRVIHAGRVLLATNAASLGLAGMPNSADPKLTFAIATAPLARRQLVDLGLASGQPFYTLDLPYLWGRVFARNRVIFGSGLVPAFGQSVSGNSNSKSIWRGLERFDVGKGEPAHRVRSLEMRVRGLHPALKNVRITHRWCGPILITKDWHPVFRAHPRSSRVLILGGFSGHGVAASVYLGRWAAQALLGRRKLPRW